jgi:hypothetical protein
VGSSKLDRTLDCIDRWGQRSGISALSRTKGSRAIQTFARNHPFIGSISEGVAFGLLMLVFSSLRTLGTHEQGLLVIWGFGALFLSAWMFVYNYRHFKRDQDRSAPPSAESNRLTGLP